MREINAATPAGPARRGRARDLLPGGSVGQEQAFLYWAIVTNRPIQAACRRKAGEINLEWARQFTREIPMKAVLLVLTSTLLFAGAFAHADQATEQEVIQTIVDGNAYAKKNLKDKGDAVSKDGSLEFWSSGGFLQKVAPGSAPDEYESVNIDAKHIHVITLVPGKVAVAQFYSEGSMVPKGSAAVSNYRTRATQVYVKEDGQWKVRAAHWSPIAGGSGTSQTAVN